MSSEEQACLVRARSDSENSGRNIAGFGSILGNRGMAFTETGPGGGTEGPAGGLMLQDGAREAPVRELETADSVEAADCRDTGVLAQFHEDAIRQAGFGRHQVMMGLVLGLAMAASGVEYAVIPYVLPSAHVEYCMTTRQKWWLGSITLLGIACGSVVWGNLADRMGRRRTLMSCLGVNAVFSVIAAFMPTIGPFMMARFCSAIGIGGAPVSAVSALSELLCGGSRRARATAPLLGGCALGAIAAAGAAALALPATGRDTQLESREHFSAWHRYLLLCTLPTMAALAGLLWAHESPRYLLECGREVEALMIYQRIYKTNRSRAAGGGAGGGAGYRLSELELPSKRPTQRAQAAPPARSALADMAFNMHQFWSSFAQLLSLPFSRTTWALAGALSACLFCHMAMLVYAPDLIVRAKNAAFQANTSRIWNMTYENMVFNTTIENRVYLHSSFINCSFRDLTFSHVVFRDCVFHDVDFSSIMSSLTFFQGSTFYNTRFIDTDLNTARHMDAGCRLLNSSVLGLSPLCPLEADHNIYLGEGLRARGAAALGALGGAVLGAVVLPSRTRPHTVAALALAAASTPAIYFLQSEASVAVYGAVFLGLLTLGYAGLTALIVESYPVHLRCTAHGFLFSLGHVLALIAASIYSSMTLNSHVLATLLTGLVAAAGAALATRIGDVQGNLM